MGFSFRRSANFGPLRLNFSKSGVGASVGVRGARVTLSPRGKTYITVGAGGFSYRQNLSSGARSAGPRPRFEPIAPRAMTDEIKTADVEELQESSKSELVEDLNRRARMINPAIFLFVLAVIAVIIGFGLMASSGFSTPPSLRDVSNVADAQANRTDEYALLLARLGQPSAVALAQAGNAPLRIATWAQIHLAISFVPAGCVDAYSFFQAHKNDPPPIHTPVRHRGIVRTPEPVSPACIPPADNATTIVAYTDTTANTGLDSFAAERALAGLTDKSLVVPTATVPDVSKANAHHSTVAGLPGAIAYDLQTLEREKSRQRQMEASESQALKKGTVCGAVGILLLVPGVILHRKNKEKRTTQLIYELSEQAKVQQEELEAALSHLSRSGAIWRLDSKSIVTDWKRNAGAAYNVKRERITVRRAVPPRIESNVEPVCLDLGQLRMFFLPDQLLYWQRGVFASIEYSDLRFESGSTNFIEESVQGSDSRQVGTTWRYVRKDGGPDQRFNDNRQLPVMQYGVVTAASSHGLNLVLHTSNLDAAGSFTATFKMFLTARARELGDGSSSANHQQSLRQDLPPGTGFPAKIVEAMRVLGVVPGASIQEVAVAYRHMAQMYHPDRTAGLGPELQALSEQKMKQINAAHQELRQFFEKA